MPKKQEPTEKSTPGKSLGLEGLGDLGALLDPADAPAAGAPMDIPLDLIDEDPNQPRDTNNPGFSDESIKEMADSIKQKGRVLQPISVRENPEHEGRYIINHGARRYRGSFVAGMKTIKAFLDSHYDQDEQVIENIQREKLTSMEIAKFVGDQMKKGRTGKEIATRLGKSQAWVSMHTTLLTLPPSIADAYEEKRVEDLTLVSELAKAHKEDQQAVERFLLDENQPITRATVKMLRDFIDSTSTWPAGQTKGAEGESADTPDAKTTDTGERPKSKKEADPTKMAKAIVKVSLDGSVGRLLLKRRPKAEGMVWVKFEDSGSEEEVDARDLKLLALVEGDVA